MRYNAYQVLITRTLCYLSTARPSTDQNLRRVPHSRNLVNIISCQGNCCVLRHQRACVLLSFSGISDRAWKYPNVPELCRKASLLKKCRFKGGINYRHMLRGYNHDAQPSFHSICDTKPRFTRLIRRTGC